MKATPSWLRALPWIGSLIESRDRRIAELEAELGRAESDSAMLIERYELLTKNLAAVYPSGYVAIGTSSRYLAFTSAAAVINFLPQGGTAGVLTGSATNPTSCNAGVLAGQLLAATLNVDFSNKGRTATGLATKRLGSGALKGKTVTEVIAIANSVIAGGSLPSGVTLSKLVDALTMINENYDNGGNEGDLY